MDTYDFKFGATRDNDPSVGIRRGRITLSNQELKPLFGVLVNKILNSCLDSLIGQNAKVIYYMPPLFVLLMSSSMSFLSVDSRSRHMCEELLHGSSGNTTCKRFRLETMRE
jgi:hypothetical protein